jgi:hypothetical protein
MTLPTAYLSSTKRVPEILEAIQKAGVPDRVTHEFLKQLGFISSSERPIIGVLKALRFLDDSGAPTDRYRRYRDPAEAGPVLAEALRDAYSDIFTINESSYQLQRADLKGMFQRASGRGERVAEAMADTFSAFSRLANFSSAASAPGASPEPPNAVAEPPSGSPTPQADGDAGSSSPAASAVVLHHDVHVHLPETTDIAVYSAIFKSLREHLLA